ncbi:MAG: hypothetical protein K2H79_03565 [Bacteroidaceae bacterium]|nr:hypothetical protein [Bacteroidaceae bacterium]
MYEKKSIYGNCSHVVNSPVAFASTTQDVKGSSVVKSLPQCQFSLSRYDGKTNAGGDLSYTEKFKVLLNCPVKETDVYATVYVNIDNSEVASAVVKIPAGKTESSNTEIKVGDGYGGKRYTLRVSEY